MIGSFAGIGDDSLWYEGIFGSERISQVFDIVMFIVSCCDSISATVPENAAQWDTNPGLRGQKVQSTSINWPVMISGSYTAGEINKPRLVRKTYFF